MVSKDAHNENNSNKGSLEELDRELLIDELMEARAEIIRLKNVKKGKTSNGNGTFSQVLVDDIIGFVSFGAHIYKLQGQELVLQGANLAADNILGVVHDELIGSTIDEVFKFIADPEILIAFKKIASEGGRFDKELFGYKDDKIDGAYDVSAFRVGNGTLAIFFKDISAKKQAEALMQASEARLRALIESTDDSVYLVDRSCCYLFISSKHLKRLGISEDEYIGTPYSQLHSPEKFRIFSDRVEEVFESGHPLNCEYMSESTRKFYIRTFSPVCDPKGTVVAVNVVSKDITDYKRMEEKLRLQSLTDDLTGLSNRRGFFALAGQRLLIADRAEGKVQLLYADIDGLKEINDRLGHQEGDKHILKAASVLKKTFRESDILARIGGDEFLVFPVQCIDGSNMAIMERLLRNIEEVNYRHPGRTLSMSIGIASYDPANPVTLEELLNEADSAMYESKKNKK